MDSYENSNCEFKDFANGKSGIFDESGTMTGADTIKEGLARATCAFANSDGGNIIIGVDDETKTITGFPTSFKRKGKTVDSLEWFNHILADLLVPRLNNYDVAVVRHDRVNSRVPAGRSVFVIEVHPSSVAPHQTANSKDFYQRIGSSTKKAEHRYLSLLWSRASFPGDTVARAWLYTVIRPMIQQLDSIENFYKSFSFKFDQEFLDLDSSSSSVPFLRIADSQNAAQFLEYYGEHDDELSVLRKKMDKVLFHFEEVKKAVLKTRILGEAMLGKIDVKLLNELGTESFLIKRLSADHPELLQKIRRSGSADASMSQDEMKRLSGVVFETEEAKRIKKILSAYTAFCLAALVFKGHEAIENFQTSTTHKSREYWSLVLFDHLESLKSERGVSSELKIFRRSMTESSRLAKKIRRSWEERRNELERRYGIPREDIDSDPANIWRFRR